MKRTLQLQGLDCAACAAELERELAAIEGVVSASIAFVNQKLTIEYDNEETLQKAMDVANSFEEVHVIEDDRGMSALKNSKRVRGIGKKQALQWACIHVCVFFFIVGIFLERFGEGKITQIFTYVCFAIAYVIVGYPVWIATAKNIVKGKIFDENFLMTLASIGAVCIGEFSESVLVMLLYQIGETLQGLAVESSRRSLSSLMALKSETATVFRGREQCSVKPEEIAIGEIVFVKVGEKVPVDGVLIDGTATLDAKSLTGEVEPQSKISGEEVLSGNINIGAAFTMRATRLYNDSAVGKILDMVENASSKKAAPEKFITKFARWYTPIVCCLALFLAIFTPLFSGLFTEGRLYFKDLTRWVQSALTFLVISCPCALIISVPLTYFSGIGACAKRGILVKGATHLDDMAMVRNIAFDKTGTLTKGIFSVRETHPVTGVSAETLLAIVAAVEKNSSHPIAKAFLHIHGVKRADSAEEMAGLGLRAEIDGEEILVGNKKLLLKKGIEFTETESADTVLYVAKNGGYIGCVEVGDILREESKTTLEELRKLGVKRQMMLTGDNGIRAKAVAEEIGLQEVYAELLPLDKLEKAKALKRNGGLIYVGDGINDAPVMSVADCSVSMGTLGSAAAVEASDFVLITDDLRGIASAVQIAKKTKRIVLQNIVFSITAKAAFMALGVVGVLPLWAAVFADVGVMLLAVVNSFRVRRSKKI